MKKPRIKYVEASELATGKMVMGNEKKYPVIIDVGELVVKRWVGFGWVTERVADASDLRKYPIVKRNYD